MRRFRVHFSARETIEGTTAYRVPAWTTHTLGGPSSWPSAHWSHALKTPTLPRTLALHDTRPSPVRKKGGVVCVHQKERPSSVDDGQRLRSDHDLPRDALARVILGGQPHEQEEH